MMNTAKKNIPERIPESYSPKQKPEILSLAEQVKATSENTEALAKGAEVRPRIIIRDNLVIAGVTGNGNETGLLWQKFEELSRSMPLSNKINDNGYEVRVYSEDGECRCHVGICIKDNSVPEGYELMAIPSSMYAAFDVYPVQGYQSRNKEMDQWLRANADIYEQVRMDDKYYSILLYDNRYKGEKDPESIVEIDVPISK